MGVLNIVIVLCGALLVIDYASGAGSCPPKHKVYNNKPECHSDADCMKYGKICCPNQYNTKSCTDRAPYGFNMRSGHDYRYPKKAFGGSTSFNGGGVHCNGQKCNPWEVCKPDPVTKRLRCQKQ